MNMDYIRRDEKRALLIAEAMFLAYMINKETDWCVFLDYSGHVDSISIEIARSKEDYLTRIAGTEFYAIELEKNVGLERDPDAFLRAKVAQLKSLLEGHDPEDIAIGVESIVTHYYNL